MDNMRKVLVFVLTSATLVVSAALSAQILNPTDMTRNMAQSFLREGRALLDAAQYGAAAGKFEEVWYMDDEDREISDLRAMAGLFLCITRARANQISAAKNACTKVIQMPDAPQQIKKDASDVLNKLK